MGIKNGAAETGDELRSEDDLDALRREVRGKYFERATHGTTLVLLERDVAEAFPDAPTVNEALRALAKVARTQAVSAGSRRRVSGSKRRFKAAGKKRRKKAVRRREGSAATVTQSLRCDNVRAECPAQLAGCAAVRDRRVGGSESSRPDHSS